jgi:hypothetical protein
MNHGNNHFRHKEFETETAARGAAAAQRARGGSYRSIRAFKCKIGGTVHWHIGRGRRR